MLRAALATLCTLSVARAILPYGHAYQTPGDFLPSEYAFIAATFPVFTVEKRHASAVYGDASAPASSPRRTNSIAASVGTARKIKALNASSRVLMYWNSGLHWNFYECEEDVKPSWLLPPSHGLSVPTYNYAVPAFRSWWVRCAIDSLRNSSGALDGLFIDAVPKLSWVGQPSNAFALWGEMLDEVRAAVPSALLLFNGDFDGRGAVIANATLLPHASGVYMESLASLGNSGAAKPDADESISYLRYLETSSAAALPSKLFFGHGLLNRTATPSSHAHSVSNEDDDAFIFGFAIFLLVTRDPAASYFLANNGYEIDQGVLTPHAEYGYDIGMPLGSFSVQGHVLTRVFEHATVVADLDAQTGSITLQSSSAHHMRGSQ